MSVPFSGTLFKKSGEISAIGKQLRLLNLKAVKRITVKFDPFRENIKHARNFAHFITAPKIGKTNPECIIKTEILCDRTEPLVICNLIPSIAETQGTNKIVLKGGNLTCLELLQLMNKYITSLAPKEEVIVTAQTKSSKKK